MAAIPKRITERFIKTLPKFQKVLQIAKDRDVNESDTVSIINDIIGEVLGYDKYIEITSELAIRGTYCDLALRVDDKVEFIVEAKAIGISLKEAHMKQACDYGANHGVQWILLTNGITWKIYRIRFEQPINYDLVATFDLMKLNPDTEKGRNLLYMLSKEGLAKDALSKSRILIADECSCMCGGRGQKTAMCRSHHLLFHCLRRAGAPIATLYGSSLLLDGAEITERQPSVMSPKRQCNRFFVKHTKSRA